MMKNNGDEIRKRLCECLRNKLGLLANRRKGLTHGQDRQSKLLCFVLTILIGRYGSN